MWRGQAFVTEREHRHAGAPSALQDRRGSRGAAADRDGLGLWLQVRRRVELDSGTEPVLAHRARVRRLHRRRARRAGRRRARAGCRACRTTSACASSRERSPADLGDRARARDPTLDVQRYIDTHYPKPARVARHQRRYADRRSSCAARSPAEAEIAGARECWTRHPTSDADSWVTGPFQTRADHGQRRAGRRRRRRRSAIVARSCSAGRMALLSARCCCWRAPGSPAGSSSAACAGG